MEPGAGSLRGVFAAVDVHYLASGGARAAVVVAGDATFSAVVAENTVIVPEVMAYRPGEFYLRELPPLRAVLRGVTGLGLLVVDGYADLDPSGRPGLGAHVYAEFGIPVVGVAKSAFLSASHAIPLRAPCWSPPPACPALTQLIWSGTWLAGSGYPMPCAVSTRWRGPGGKQRTSGVAGQVSGTTTTMASSWSCMTQRTMSSALSSTATQHRRKHVTCLPPPAIPTHARSDRGTRGSLDAHL
jgi:hypothetical protein